MGLFFSGFRCFCLGCQRRRWQFILGGQFERPVLALTLTIFVLFRNLKLSVGMGLVFSGFRRRFLGCQRRLRQFAFLAAPKHSLNNGNFVFRFRFVSETTGLLVIPSTLSIYDSPAIGDSLILCRRPR